MNETKHVGYVSTVKAVDEKSRTVTHLISDGSIDRDGDMIEPAGWVTERFEKNPVVMADHGRSVLNIIGTGKVRKMDDGLLASTTFHDVGIGAAAFDLVRSKIARAWSVGFVGLEGHSVRGGAKDGCERCEHARDLQLEAQKDEEFAVVRGIHFLKQELMEYSLVAIPSNPNAVMAAAKEHKLDLKLVRKFIEGDALETQADESLERAVGEALDGAEAESASSSLLAQALTEAVKRARLRTALSKNRRNENE